MYLSNTRLNYRKNIWPTLNKIQSILGKDNRSFATALDLPLSEFLMAKLNQTELPAYSVCALLESLDIDSDLFFSDQLDYQLLARSASGLSTELPKKYTENAFGTLATPKAFFDSLIESNDSAQMVEIFRALQLSPDVLLDESRPVNLLFTLDLFKHLNKRSKAEKFMLDFGLRSGFAPRPKEFDQQLKDARSFKETFEMFPFLIETFVEKNFHYSIHRLHNQHCSVKVWPREHVVEIIKKSPQYSKHLSLLCLARVTYARAVALRAGYDAQVKETSCCFDGHSRCTYWIEFKQPYSALPQMEV